MFWLFFFLFFKEVYRGFPNHHASKRTLVLICTLEVHNQYWYMKRIYYYAVNGFSEMYQGLQWGGCYKPMKFLSAVGVIILTSIG